MEANKMKIIDFEGAKAKKYSKNVNNSPYADNGELEIEKQYPELVKFYEDWYDKHVVGQDETGRWIYK